MEIKVCVGSSCHLKGSYDVIQKLKSLIEEKELENKIELKASFCLGNCSNGVSMKIDDDSIYLIDNVPLIDGYSSDELKEISRGFRDTDPDVIKQISEIHKYPVSYDDKQMEVIMKDGNYCFMSFLALDLLENYYAVSSSIDKTKGYACIYFDDFTNSAYASICPWQSTE